MYHPIVKLPCNKRIFSTMYLCLLRATETSERDVATRKWSYRKRTTNSAPTYVTAFYVTAFYVTAVHARCCSQVDRTSPTHKRACRHCPTKASCINSRNRNWQRHSRTAVCTRATRVSSQDTSTRVRSSRDSTCSHVITHAVT